MPTPVLREVLQRAALADALDHSPNPVSVVFNGDQRVPLFFQLMTEPPLAHKRRVINGTLRVRIFQAPFPALGSLGGTTPREERSDSSALSWTIILANIGRSRCREGSFSKRRVRSASACSLERVLSSIMGGVPAREKPRPSGDGRDSIAIEMLFENTDVTHLQLCVRRHVDSDTEPLRDTQRKSLKLTTIMIKPIFFAENGALTEKLSSMSSVLV